MRAKTKRIVFYAGLFTILLVGGALLFAWSGIYSVAVAQKHWPPIRWFLAFGMRNSVEMHARSIEAPSLDDPSLVMRGAGHYEGGCAPCHGAPGRARNPIPLQMLPHPPYLPNAGQWTKPWQPSELFWIVKNGLKYAGMPGWVALKRDDEIWAVVAFLLRIKEMSGPEYRRLAFGDLAQLAPAAAPENPRLLALTGPLGGGIAACARCHGLDGDGQGIGAYPRLSIQSPAYLYAALKAYSLGGRPSGIMQPVAVELSDAEMRVLADYYAQAGGPDAVRSPDDFDPELLRLGAALAQRGASAGVTACVACHDPERNPLYPTLAGQYADYIATQLRLFRAGIRGGPNGVVMSAVARQMTDQQINAVALYYSTLRPDAAYPGPITGAVPPLAIEGAQP